MEMSIKQGYVATTCIPVALKASPPSRKENDGSGENNIVLDGSPQETDATVNAQPSQLADEMVPAINEENLLNSFSELNISEREARQRISQSASPNEPNQHQALFDRKLPSAFKITDPEMTSQLLSAQIKKGWRWVAPGWLPKRSNPTQDPVAVAKQMPLLATGDWVMLEGKTIRLLKATTTDEKEKAWYEKLEKELVARDDDLFNWFCEYVEIRPTATFYPGELAPNFFEESYGRLAGAYLRHLERLPILKKGFSRFFKMEEKELAPYSLCAKLHGSSEVQYKKMVKITLNDTPIGKKDLPLLQALGIKLKADLTDQSTVENTIPFKKVLQMLTCFDPWDHLDRPWLVRLPIFGKTRSILLSKGQHVTRQPMVSRCIRLDKEKKTFHFVGHRYSDWVKVEKMTAQIVNATLNNPLCDSPKFIEKEDEDNRVGDKILEFLVCTQIAEAHCVPNHLNQSRIPGTGKQARAIFQYHQDENTPLFPSFDIKRGNQRMFPMAGAGGTGDTRTAVDDLVRPVDKAPVYDMSEDSSVEDINDCGSVSGEGR